MNKKDIQKRVLQNGKLLDLKKFEWDEKSKVFSSIEDNLVIDFSDISNSTIKAWGDNIVIINRNVFEAILPKKNDTIQICPHKIKGHLINGLYNGEPHIIADNILSKIISKKGNLYKVINHNQDKISYLIESEIDNKKVYSHGATIKEARESLVYKLSNRDTSEYNSLNLDSILIRDEAIQCYMAITGACGAGTKYFIDNLDKVKKEYSIKEIIDLTKNQFGNEKFKEFFKK